MRRSRPSGPTAAYRSADDTTADQEVGVISDELFPAAARHVPPAVESAAPPSPLDAAAARGDIRWPADPDLDPEGTPEPLNAPKSHVGKTMTGFVGSRGFPPN